MAIASFTIPSPKIMENNVGLWSNFIIVRAATASDAQSVAEKSKISLTSKWII